MKILPVAVEGTFMTGQKAIPFYKWEWGEIGKLWERMPRAEVFGEMSPVIHSEGKSVTVEVC